MVMAIRRCPYCKAIIDGVAEYCSNCGTQLLFPEDEFKEEEIPGDKIVEEEEKEEETLETEEAESEKEEPSVESVEEEEKEEETLEAEEAESEKEEPSPESAEEEEGEEKEEGEKEDEEREEEEKAVTPPQIEDIDIKAAEALQMKEAREIVKKETERLWASVGTGDVEKSPDVDIEFPMPSEEEKEEIEATPPPPGEEIDIRSIRLRRTPDTEDREKEEIERFVESVKAERGKEVQPSEETPLYEEREREEREEMDLRNIRMRRTPDTEMREKVEIERFVESIKKERDRVREAFTPKEEILPPKEMGEVTSEIKEKIPPWAEKIKKEPPQELGNKEEERKVEKPVESGEDFQEKEKKTPVDKPLSPTDELLPPADELLPPADELLPPADKPLLSEKEIGFPEEVDQKVSFAREIREKRKRAMRRRRSGYYAWLKARAFDFVFIAAFSLICLGLASRLMEVSLFRLISASGPPVLVFYFVLLLFYFGFFILFLGETPGDRLFPRN